MATSLALALLVTVGLLAVAALGRRALAPGWQRNALSVAMVVLGLATAFIVCFGGGVLVQRLRSQAEVHGAMHLLPSVRGAFIADGSCRTSGLAQA
jgi:hypothetical protein